MLYHSVSTIHRSLQIAVYDRIELLQRLPTTAIIALHDLNQATLCDRICVLQDGKLRAIGTPSEIMTETLLREVFGVCGHFLVDPADNAQVIRFHTATH